jgi:isoquinoline 1-oxidoreductase subunit beta
LSTALHEVSELVDGLPKDTNLGTYTPLCIGDVPDIDVELIPRAEVAVGLGEPATTVVAPAIANAIFAALRCARVRHLPIRPEPVRQAFNARS